MTRARARRDLRRALARGFHWAGYQTFCKAAALKHDAGKKRRPAGCPAGLRIDPAYRSTVTPGLRPRIFPSPRISRFRVKSNSYIAYIKERYFERRRKREGTNPRISFFCGNTTGRFQKPTAPVVQHHNKGRGDEDACAMGRNENRASKVAGNLSCHPADGLHPLLEVPVEHPAGGPGEADGGHGLPAVG